MSTSCPTATSRPITTALPRKTPRPRENFSPTRNYSPVKIISQPSRLTNDCPNGGKNLIFIIKKNYFELSLMIGFGRYCCLNGANHPNCCFYDTRGQYCCTINGDPCCTLQELNYYRCISSSNYAYNINKF